MAAIPSLLLSLSIVLCPGEKGVPLISTPSKVLLCNWVVKPGETKKGEYNQTYHPLYRGCPLFRGFKCHDIKYFIWDH